MILDNNVLKDGVGCHLASASGAGFVAVIVGSPVDVLKTRVMNAPKGMYTGPIDCIVKTLKNEGPLSFYKGFVPNVYRLVLYNCIIFLTLEKVKATFA